MKPRKQKKCKACGILFTPEKAFQVVCDYRCGLKHAQNQAKKAADRKKAKAHREAKERVKTRSEWMREAQAAFNGFIRERDRDQPCISCGRYHEGQYHAGHYRSVGSCPELRFEETQVHKQCAPCNNHLSGNLINYRQNLILKIGKDGVDWLEGPHVAKHYTIDDLKRIKALYLAKTRELKKGLAVAVTYEDKIAGG